VGVRGQVPDETGKNRYLRQRRRIDKLRLSKRKAATFNFGDGMDLMAEIDRIAEMDLLAKMDPLAKMDLLARNGLFCGNLMAETYCGNGTPI